MPFSRCRQLVAVAACCWLLVAVAACCWQLVHEVAVLNELHMQCQSYSLCLASAAHTTHSNPIRFKAGLQCFRLVEGHARVGFDSLTVWKLVYPQRRTAEYATVDCCGGCHRCLASRTCPMVQCYCSAVRCVMLCHHLLHHREGITDQNLITFCYITVVR